MSYRERRNRKDSRAKTSWQIRKALARSMGNHAVFIDGQMLDHPGRKAECGRCGHGDDH